MSAVMRVLVVGAEEPLRGALGEALAERGHAAVFARDLADERAEGRFALIVVAGAGAAERCRAIRAREEGAEPVVLAVAPDADGAALLQAGASDVHVGAPAVPALAARLRVAEALVAERDGRRWAHATLAAAEARFQTLAEASFEAIAVHVDGRIVQANRALAELLGYDVGELIGMAIADLAGPADVAAVLARVKARQEEPYRATVRRRDGTLVPCAVRGKTVTSGGLTFRVAVLRDLSEEERARERLREERDFAATILDTVDALVVVLDRDARVVRFNRACERVTGWSAAEAVGRVLWDFLLPLEEAERIRPHFARLVAEGGPSRRENEWVARDGSPRLISWANNVLRTPTGATAYVVATGIDVTDVRRAEAALAASEGRFRRLIESAPDAVTVMRQGGRLAFANQAFKALLGIDAATDVVGRQLSEFMVVEEVEVLGQRLGAMFASGTAPPPREYRGRRLDGTPLVVEVRSIVAEFEGEPAVIGFARDVTERKRMEAQLRRAEHMASLGTLAAGVAHEINNPMAYVVANLDWVAARIGRANADPTALAAAVEEARQGAARVTDIVKGLRVFSRGDDEAVGPVDLRTVIDFALRIAGAELRPRARVVVEVEDVPPVLAGAARLGQALVNLLVNAAQAIPEGASDRHAVHVRGRRGDDGRVVVEVADTGVGISAEHLPRLFDPFFTTKPVGLGTGLGLFISQGIVSSLGGEITVESEPGRGTTFRLALPAAAGPVPARAPRPASPPTPRKRVLIVDDDAPLGGSMQRLLEADHDVVVETDGAAALLRVAAGERFDVIFCDLMMPEMTGMELFGALQQSAPDQAERMVFLTGGAFTPRARAFLEEVENPRLEKPFTAQALEDVLRRP